MISCDALSSKSTFLCQMYSKKDIETQPIKGGSLQEVGEAEETEPHEVEMTADNQPQGIIYSLPHVISQLSI